MKPELQTHRCRNPLDIQTPFTQGKMGQPGTKKCINGQWSSHKPGRKLIRFIGGSLFVQCMEGTTSYNTKRMQAI